MQKDYVNLRIFLPIAFGNNALRVSLIRLEETKRSVWRIENRNSNRSHNRTRNCNYFFGFDFLSRHIFRNYILTALRPFDSYIILD